MADFTMIWDLRLQGAQQAKADLDAYLVKMKEGTGTTEELKQKTSAYEQNLRQLWTTQRVARQEFAATHPELFQLTQAFSMVGRAANTFLGIINAFNLNTIRQLINGQTDVNNLLVKQSFLQSTIASLQGLVAKGQLQDTDIRLVTAKQDLATTKNDIIAAQSQAQSSFISNIGSMIAGTLSAAGAISQLIQGWSKIRDLMVTIRGLSVATSIYNALGSIASSPVGVAIAGAGIGAAIGVELQASQNNTDFFTQLTTDVKNFATASSPIVSSIGSTLLSPLGIKVPGLAEGGIVTSPTLALVGEKGPEAVIPLRGSSPGSADSMTVNLSVGGSIHTLDSIVESVSRKMRENTAGMYR